MGIMDRMEVGRGNATAERVKQIIYKVEEKAKRDAVVHLMKQREIRQVIVFSNTKIGASRLARELERAGVKASAIHGDKTQAERMAALEAFKAGGIDVLVATDVAARGIDVDVLPLSLIHLRSCRRIYACGSLVQLEICIRLQDQASKYITMECTYAVKK